MDTRPVRDLTRGGTCDLCGPKGVCCACKATGRPLYYARSGDHDHLITIGMSLGREAHGRFMCKPCYLKDWAETVPNEPLPEWEEDATWIKQTIIKTPEPSVSQPAVS